MGRSQKTHPIQKSGGNPQKSHLDSPKGPSSPSGTSTDKARLKNDGMSPKPSDHCDPTKLYSRPTKRLKSNAGSAIPATSIISSPNTPKPASSTDPTQADPTSSLPLIPAEIQHLQNQYDISTISIISSSKIHPKVKSLIDRVEKFTFANVTSKPGVVVLHAKAEAASKMISIIEIAKDDIQTRGGKWYEYSKLHSELLEFKEKQRKQPQTGRTMAGGAPVSNNTAEGKTGLQRTDAGDEKDNVDDDMNGSDGEVAFETLQHQNNGATPNGKNKVRATPIMSIYFARVPVPGLKDLFG
ncbi:MAG: hypothetical protein Q9168_002097 [Polycauliona sp. 1 TL-2023]